MYCFVCRKFPTKADRARTFYKGTQNYRTGLRCTRKKPPTFAVFVGKAGGGQPISWATSLLDTTGQQRQVKLINTAYHIVKSELPFTAYKRTVALLKKNGEDVGSQYLTNVACRRELWESCVAEIKAANFLSVLSDSSTDVSGRDLEGFFVRILSCRRPKNIFIGVEKLQYATAPGHFAAMSAALDKADISQWKDKVVGLGTDGAAVMVGRIEGVATLLCAEVPHLINIQCLSHGLDLAAMDAMKDQERMRKASDGHTEGAVLTVSSLSKSVERVERSGRCVQPKGLEDDQFGRDKVAPTHGEGTQGLVEKLPSIACPDGKHSGSKASNTFLFPSLSLKLQEDGLTLPEALYAFETAVLRLTAMEIRGRNVCGGLPS
ncbi:unnamed protein product [Leuciscus chuanchicus]